MWIEGPSAGEPTGHMSFAVGDPNGKYRTFSFGFTGEYQFSIDFLKGEAYEDFNKGGKILRFAKTTVDQDKFMTYFFILYIIINVIGFYIWTLANSTKTQSIIQWEIFSFPTNFLYQRFENSFWLIFELNVIIISVITFIVSKIFIHLTSK